MSLVRLLLIALGSLSLALGVIGIFLPLLPTTPFLLLSAYLYYRSSPRYYQWLMNQPRLGPYIRNYRENKIIPLRAKIFSLTLMWGSILYCVFFLIDHWAIRIALICISVAVTWHILSFKSK